MTNRNVVDRTVVGFLGAGVAWLVAVVGVEAYFRGESGAATAPAYCAAAGFFLAAACGKCRIAGRPASIISGVVSGVALGACFGHLWGRIEHAIVWHRIESAGRYPNNKGIGFSPSRYDDIGVRYGIGLGAIAGIAVGSVWKPKTRSSWIIVVAAAGLVMAGILEMNAAFRAQSADEIRKSHPEADRETIEGDWEFK